MSTSRHTGTALVNGDFVARVMSCLALWLSLTGGPAEAALVTMNDPMFGPNSLVLDTSTGLEWLNLTRTQGRSAGQVFAQLRPTGEFAGFQYADRNQFVTLFTEVFGRPGLLHPFGDLDLHATENFATLFGPTGMEVIDNQRLPTISGIFDVTVQTSRPSSATLIGFFYNFGLSGLGGGSDTDSVSLDYRNFEVGSFLVRAVPEPPLSLLSAGLMGLAAVMLRRKRKTART